MLHIFKDGWKLIQLHQYYTDCPLPPQKKKKKKKITIRLLASITFKIMNQSKYALGFWNYNWLSAFCRKPPSDLVQ